MNGFTVRKAPEFGEIWAFDRDKVRFIRDEIANLDDEKTKRICFRVANNRWPPTQEDIEDA